METKSPNLLYFSSLFVLILWLSNSCSDDKPVNWREEMTGVGILSSDTISLVKAFTFNVQISFNGPFVNGRLSNDTLRLHPYALRDFVVTHQRPPFFDDTVFYRLTKLPGRIRLTKIAGSIAYPETLYFKKSMKPNPKFGFYLEQGWGGDSGPYQLKVDSAMRISVALIGSCKPVGEVFILKKLSCEDSIFVHSFLNLLSEKRYETKRITDRIICTTDGGGEAILLYNDSLYNYETYQPLPFSLLLMPYFESRFAKIFRKKGAVTTEMLDQPILLRKKYPSAIEAVPPPPLPEIIKFLPPVKD